jgi:hypothetical protein
MSKPRRSMRFFLDVISDLRCSDPAITQAEATQRLDLQLMASPLTPTLAAVKILPPALRSHRRPSSVRPLGRSNGHEGHGYDAKIAVNFALLSSPCCWHAVCIAETYKRNKRPALGDFQGCSHDDDECQPSR